MSRRSTRQNLASLVAALLVALVAAVSMLWPARPASTELAAPEDTVAQTQDQPSAETPSQPADAERDEFVGAWAPRIDAFNAGYPLEGYGATFAEAAYDNGVDPRYAPAIARVESGSGQACTYACNAWGWGTASWPDWDTAIRSYTAELAAGYGYSLSYEAALRYNEETPDEWYAQVEGCMEQI